GLGAKCFHRSQSGVMAEYYGSANSVLAAQSATKFVERAG
ncbi:MAG: hypothetical protein QOF25_2325, partial [Mycobacterium sp.]|nr:hypothetical protein [Mycobacterium sp.]